MLHELAGEANFTEMFTMDFSGGGILMNHMGEGNWKLARKDRPVRLVRSGFTLSNLKYRPASLSFSLEPGEATLLSLTTSANGKAKFVVTEGKVEDFPPLDDIRSPHFKFAPFGPLSDFLTQYSMEGGSHHQALAYGRRAGAIAKVASILGVECAMV
jgi:L-arabinose isomerase